MDFTASHRQIMYPGIRPAAAALEESVAAD
jgi:hypothetical protein